MNDIRFLRMNDDTIWEETDFICFYESGYKRLYKVVKKHSTEERYITGDLISYYDNPMGKIAKDMMELLISQTPFVPEGFIPYEEKKEKETYRRKSAFIDNVENPKGINGEEEMIKLLHEATENRKENKPPTITKMGDKCPICNSELVRASNNILYTSPLQQEVRCSNKECDYEGNQFLYKN